MSAALPNRNWRAIRIKIYEIIGKRSFYISPKPIRDEETYADYIERMERTGWKQPRKSGSRWIEEEIDHLEKLLDEAQTRSNYALPSPTGAGRKYERKSLSSGERNLLWRGRRSRWGKMRRLSSIWSVIPMKR